MRDIDWWVIGGAIAAMIVMYAAWLFCPAVRLLRRRLRRQ
jgi:hypothetical protein